MNEGYELTMAQIRAGADVLVWPTLTRLARDVLTLLKKPTTYIFGAVSDIQNEAPDQSYFLSLSATSGLLC
ncbi:MAG: hypothetical protein ACOX1Y_08035 [Zhaonellaceae bacterium]